MNLFRTWLQQIKVIRSGRLFAVVILLLVLSVGMVAWMRPRVSVRATDIQTGSVIPVETIGPGWPQLRGPTMNSVSAETELADHWPDTGPPLLWTRELGQGYSSFAVVGNRAFTQCQSLYQQSLVCLNADTGETIWSYNCGWPFEASGLYPGPRSTPTVHQGFVYFSTPEGIVGCLRADNGHLVWSCNPKKIHQGLGTDFGYASSPLIVEGRVIVPVGGKDASVVALDCRDGSTVWQAGHSSASYATPLSIQWNGRTLVVTPLENTLVAVEAKTGKLLWEIPFSEGYDEHSAALLYQEPDLCIASPFRAGAKCFRLEDEVNVPRIKWESLKLSNDVVSSLLVNDRIYGFDLKDPQSRLNRPSRGEFRCLDFKTGKVIWSTDRVGQASAISADNKMILFNDSGELILARPDTEEYMELARTQVFRDEICWTSPALDHGRIYLRTQTRAACLDLSKVPRPTTRPTHNVAEIPRATVIDAKWLIGGEREFPATVPEVTEFWVWYQWCMAIILLASPFAWLLQVLTVGFFHRIILHNIRSNLSITNTVRTFREIASGTPAESNTVIDVISHDQQAGFWLVGIERTIGWLLILVMGVCGSPFVNSWQHEYVLLWPVALWSAFQSTINMITWTERQPDRKHFRWYSRVCGLAFVALCTTYFILCRRLGYAIEWSFLIGFLPAFAVSAGVARVMISHRKFWRVTDLIAATLSFTAYFWLSILFIKWKFVVGS